MITTIKNKLNPSTQKLMPLFSVMLFDHISVNITFPVLTFVFFSPLSNLFLPSTSIAERTLWYGLAMSVAHIGGIISSAVTGTLSDTLGRKRLLLFAAFAGLVFAVSCTLGILAGSLVVLMFGKVIGGLISRTNPVAQATIGDISQGAEKAVHMGYLQVVISIGAFIGPVLGGFLAQRFFFKTLNFSLPYIVAGLFSIIAIFLTVFAFKETLREPKPARLGLQSWAKFLTNKEVLKITGLLLMTQIAWSAYYQFMPPILKVHFHYSVHMVGLFVGMIALWLAIASFFGPKILKSFLSLRAMISVSLGMMLLGLLLTLMSTYFHQTHMAHALLWIGAVPVAMGDVLVYTFITTLYSDCVAHNEQGAVMGMSFVLITAVWGLTALLSGLFATLHITMPLYLGLAALLVLMVLRYKRFHS